MIYLSENTHILLLFLLLLIALIVYFKMNFQQIKAAEIDRLNLMKRKAGTAAFFVSDFCRTSGGPLSGLQ